jgi:hypothetical protein
MPDSSKRVDARSVVVCGSCNFLCFVFGFIHGSAPHRPYKKPGLGWPGTRPRGTLRPGRPGGGTP